MTGPTIYELVIERFRGIQTLSWQPAKGLNVILGGGDVGKTTILEAIALLLSPSNPTVIPDTDYYGRNNEPGFLIEAVLALPPETGINNLLKPSWPWEWDGTKAVVPSIDGATSKNSTPVYRLRVHGTEDLELAYEILQPDGTADWLSVGLRRAIGLVRIGGDDRSDRDLRLVQGSALDRLLSDKALRSRLASKLAEGDVKGNLADDGKKALDALDSVFGMANLPSALDLAITGGPGLSVTALIGLTAEREGARLPLTTWGAGTRRIAALTIAEQNQGDAPITVVDEVERGLEPYRQRSLMEKLRAGRSQVFVTTHSPFAISASSMANLWYVDHAGRIGPLDRDKTELQRKKDPGAFLSRLTIVGEGATEVGFVTALLERALDVPLSDLGIHVSDGEGHEATLDLVEALAAGGLQFAAFVDNENGKHSERWERLKAKLGNLLFRWTAGCLEENFMRALSDEGLERLLTDPTEEMAGLRLRTLADRLGSAEKDFGILRGRAESGLRKVILEAALGTVPHEVQADQRSEKRRYKAHAQSWFKSVDGGRELAGKVFSLDVWSALKPQLLPFCNAIRATVGLAELADLSP